MYIYLDESGDLGFDFTKSKTTRKFVVTLLCCESLAARRDMEKAVHRTLKKLNKPKQKGRRKTELKGTNTSADVKNYFYRQIRRPDWSLLTVVLNKSRVEKNLQSSKTKQRLYNFLARFIVEKLPLEQTRQNVQLVVDRSKNRDEIRDFNRYLTWQIQARLPLNTGFRIEHLTSHESPGLQAVDLFSWGIFRKYEWRDYHWYGVYGSKIRYETEYLRDTQA